MTLITEETPILSNKANQAKGYSHELKWLLKNSMPLVVSYLLQNSLQSISIITAGHLVIDILKLWPMLLLIFIFF